MYIPPHFAETRIEVLHGLLRAHPLATLVVAVGGDVAIDHLPLLLVGEAANGTLHGHLPRANPVWRALDGDTPAVAVFHGPEAYVTPSWYPAKQAHGKVVPTWDYAVVHARGRPRIVDDRDWLLAHVTALTREHEAGQPLPWQVSDAPRDYVERMLDALVGLEMPIETLTGKWKVSQNREAPDRQGVAAGLRARGDRRALDVADLVVERGTGRRLKD